ncbi:MAG: Crp/Fnr family transcriptional regulator [Parasphingorhabdus sp.]|uniref:Crp/Fnr family transcriptional regulator n=1 Tax=Parasphingorhabdus sp. TaxID=2709688 RepID=UPI003299596F
MLRGLQLVDSPQTARSTFTAAGFVTALPDSVRQQLLAHAEVRRFKKGDLIQQRGDTGKEFWHIRSGSVQIGRYSLDGKLTIFAVIGPGESFGEQAFLGGFTKMVDAIAGSEVTLLRIGESELQAAIESHPNVARILLRAMAHMVQQAFDLIEAGRNRSTVERTAQAILGQCEDRHANLEVRITHQELADLVGVSRVSLGKALSKLDDLALIQRRYGRIIIPDRKALASFLAN